MFSFFFFQAEDGIRDKLVTGVQTCALPISFEITTSTLASGMGISSIRPSRHSACLTPDAAAWASSLAHMRSEERREGKSVDLGGRRIIKKKKKRTRSIKQ